MTQHKQIDILQFNLLASHQHRPESHASACGICDELSDTY